MKVALASFPSSSSVAAPKPCPRRRDAALENQAHHVMVRATSTTTHGISQGLAAMPPPTRRVTRASAALAQSTTIAAPLALHAVPSVASTLTLRRPLVAWDLEATGLSRDQDQIIEFGAVKRFPDGRADACLRLRFNPTCEINYFAFKAHGIRAADLQSEPRFESAAEQITMFLSDCDFVGHNMKRFDVPMLGSSLARAVGKTWKLDFDWPAADVHVLDTYLLFRNFVPDKERAGGNHKLVTCYPYYTHKPLENAHSALADAQACMDVVQAMADAACTGAAIGFPRARQSVTVPALAAFGITATEAAAQRGSRARSPED